MNRRRKPPNCSFQRTRFPTTRVPPATGAPLNSSLGRLSRDAIIANVNLNRLLFKILLIEIALSFSTLWFCSSDDLPDRALILYLQKQPQIRQFEILSRIDHPILKTTKPLLWVLTMKDGFIEYRVRISTRQADLEYIYKLRKKEGIWEILEQRCHTIQMIAELEKGKICGPVCDIVVSDKNGKKVGIKMSNG